MNISRRLCPTAAGAFLLSLGTTAFAAVTTTVVDIPVTDGTQRFLYVKPDAPVANIISVPGGDGVLGIQNDGSMPTITGQCNPIGRVRQTMAERGYAIALVDANSIGAVRGADDVVEVARYMKARHNVPTWIIGGSASTAAVVNIAAGRPADFNGGLIVNSPARPNSAAGLVTRPTLVVAHALDPDQYAALMFSALTAASVRERATFNGGSNAGCGYHLFNGLDAEFADAVSGFIARNNTATAALNYSDLWWAGTAENGWGMTVQQHGNVQFNVLFVYDATGKPTWYAMPGCTWNATFTVCNGQLAKPASSPLNNYNAAQFNPGGAVGTISLSYTSADTANLQYVINGIPGQKNIQRQVFGPVDNTPGLQVGDMWWAGEAQNGWGVSITQQYRTLFAAWYTYDPAGNATWYTMPGGSWNGNTYSGGLAAVTSSPWLGAAYNPGLFAPSQVGTVSFAFQDANNATMTYTFTSGPFAGTTQTKQIVRQPY